jgi:acetylornithine deacetylase
MDTATLCTDLLGELVRIPSVNPALAPGEGAGERAMAEWIVAWARSRGMRAWLEEAAPDRPNALVEAGAADAAGTLLLCAHTDTVSARGMEIDPFEPRVEGGRLYGRGSYDMKGGVAACLAALQALHRLHERGGFDGRVLGAFVVDEEFASAGAFDVAGRHRADACVLTEPSALALVLAHKGFVWAEITTRGTAAHGSRWDLGRSAVHAAGRIVAELDRFDRDVLRARTHPLCGPASLHCATITGGDGWSTYAAACTLRVERRTLPGETAARVLDELRACVEAAGTEAEIEVKLTREPMEAARTSHVAAAVRAAARHVLGREPEEIGVAYWMDAAIFHAAGIPTVNIGHDGAGAHAAVEYAELASVTELARILEHTAMHFFTPGRPG